MEHPPHDLGPAHPAIERRPRALECRPVPLPAAPAPRPGRGRRSRRVRRSRAGGRSDRAVDRRPRRGRRDHDRRPPRPPQAARRPRRDAAPHARRGRQPEAEPGRLRRAEEARGPRGGAGARGRGALRPLEGRRAAGHRGGRALRGRRHPAGEADPRRHPLEGEPAPRPRGGAPHRERGGAARLPRGVRVGPPAPPRPPRRLLRRQLGGRRGLRALPVRGRDARTSPPGRRRSPPTSSSAAGSRPSPTSSTTRPSPACAARWPASASRSPSRWTRSRRSAFSTRCPEAHGGIDARHSETGPARPPSRSRPSPSSSRAAAAPAADAPLRVIVFGAHPDDCDLDAGGTAALWAAKGHQVKFVSVTNGDAGHQSEGGGALARRRRAEAQEAGRRFGIAEYEVLDNHDGELEPTLAVRQQVIRRIRQWNADVVIAPRPNDYHPDHRYTGVLVQDTAYMVDGAERLPRHAAPAEEPGLPLLARTASSGRTRSGPTWPSPSTR